MIKIGTMMILYRGQTRKSLRDCAKEIGVSASTLCRIESGKTCDINTLLKVMNWLFS